jgi:hypothetical protein
MVVKTKKKLKANVIVGNPMSTGEVSRQLGIVLTNEFLIRVLKLKPLLQVKNTCYWDDLDAIKQRLATYFTNLAKVK